MTTSPRKTHLDRGNGKPWCFVRSRSYALGDDTTADCAICFKQREQAPGPNQMLTCSRCKEKKRGTEFGLDSRRPRGRSSYCPPCRAAIERNDRLANRVTTYAKYKERRRRNPNSARRAALRNNKLYPKAAYARSVVRNEVKRGRLSRGCCEVCGSAGVHGHHDDYDRPLAVRWLCPIHHREWHLENGPGANIEGQPVHVGSHLKRTA